MGDSDDDLWWDSVAGKSGIPKVAEGPSDVLFERNLQGIYLNMVIFQS